MNREQAEKQAEKYNKIPDLSAVVVRTLGYGSSTNDYDVEVTHDVAKLLRREVLVQPDKRLR